ncbi:MAG: hypothetical protein M3406_14585 [Chloroflexota bacterium]|nr:hypothetical protein [Chloroflexota bacterium]
MGFDSPGFDPGPSLDDWAGLEARRAERTQRAERPDGHEISPRSRRFTGWILGLLALGMILYAALGWLGIISVPAVNV